MTSRLHLDVAWLAGATPMMTGAYWMQRGTRAASLAGLGRGDGQTAEPIRQVGRWFERVHLAGLRSTPGMELLAANTPLRAGGRTIGELDVLYRHGGRVVHREVAVKFYLCTGSCTDPAAWVGPGKKDRLDLKLQRLATHQSTVATQAREASAWPEDLPFPDVTEVLLLGSLFCSSEEPALPDGVEPSVDLGRWYYASDFAERFKGDRWCILDKPWWLSPEHVHWAREMAAEELADGLRQPRFVARRSSPAERAFIVPDGW